MGGPMRESLAIVVSFSMAVMLAQDASAQRRAAGGGRRAEPASPVAEAAALLASANPDELRLAFETLGASGSAAAVAPIADRIRQGLPAPLLEAALDALLALRRPEAGPVLFELVSHRRPAVRLRAVGAIVALRPPGADRALVAALADSDARVRSAAATGLGQLGARDSVETLFVALERGVYEAATSIGQLGGSEHVRRLLGLVGRVPFDVLTPALQEVIARRDVDERTKLDVIARIGELATPEARTFLREVVASLPAGPGGRNAIRRAAEEAAARIVE
ncbi:MAG: HEAT repeat domain-containing protein [Myxococcota bacterium]|nr:HEAT repeat domain-containing protein [Myxococcota bacterium]MDW8360945.1 HEAT repeat domain-containing protein [Myxococcales bacterium]